MVYGSINNKRVNQIEETIKSGTFFREFRYLAWITAYIFLLIGLIPTGNAIPGRITDKILHGLGFYFLVLFFAEGYGWKKKWIFFAFAILWGLLLEGVQALVPWRDASHIDFAFDVIGAFLALITPRSLFDLLMKLAGSLCYTGKIPVAPATFASAFTLILYYISPFRSSALLVLLPFILISGIWISSYCEDVWGADSNIIVIDEVVGVLVTVLFHSKTVLTLFLAFILFRFFDIKKPFYIRIAENFPRGFGVVMDDVFAGILANLTLTLISVIDRYLFGGLF